MTSTQIDKQFNNYSLILRYHTSSYKALPLSKEYTAQSLSISPHELIELTAFLKAKLSVITTLKVGATLL